MGLTCSSFFLQTTQNAGVLTSGLVCSWQVICAVLFQSAAIRMHCDSTGV